MKQQNIPFYALPINRRDAIRYSCLAGGSLILGLYGGPVMSSSQTSRVSYVRTRDRALGVERSIASLGFNPVKNKSVLLKPNFNTASWPPPTGWPWTLWVWPF